MREGLHVAVDATAFTWEACARRTSAVYREALGAR